MIAAAIASQAQTAGIPVFPSSVFVRPSTTGTTSTNPNIFGSSTQNLTCAESPIVATVSSTPDGMGNVLIDNYLNLTLTQGGHTTGPKDICRGGIVEGTHPDCFTKGYQVPSLEGKLNGMDPNGSIAATGGVAPIDISSLLVSGANTVKFDEVDTGILLTATSVYLYTNCTPSGTTSGGTVSGNPITPATITQNFTFSGTQGRFVGMIFDLSTAQNAGTLTIPGGSTPTTTDLAIDPTTFPTLVKGTSFATSQCLIHLGETLDDGSPACKLYELTCQLGTGTDASGLNCPTTTSRNIVLQDVFDFPPLSLPDIVYTNGGFSETFHQGFGFLEASEDWTDGPCTFEAGSDQLFSCPENLLTEFAGPGLGRGTGTSQPGLNSKFISVGPVPEYATHVDLHPYSANRMWVNSHNPTATFNTRSPILPPNFDGNNDMNNGFVAAPPFSITYGVAPLAGYPYIPSTEFAVPGDQTILYPGGCPAPGTPAPAIWEPAPVKLHVNEDGMYLVHYFATDCAGTEELYFRQDAGGSWYTTFYTAIMFVDTVKPKVVSGPVLGCTGGKPDSCVLGVLDDGVVVYKQHSFVHATYQCSDDFSGVAVCGGETYANPITNPPPFTSGINTSRPGIFPYFVNVIDAAGNEAHSAVIWYAVL